MGIVLVWSRLANLGTSFWTDEAHSAYYEANRGPRGIFSSDYLPNNHVLFNLLNWLTIRFTGQFEAAYRFWSVVPALVAVALVAWWLWSRVGRVAGAAVVVFATVSHVHLVLAPQARGYGLAMLAGAAMLVCSVRASDRGTTREVVLFAVGAFVGICTLPVFALAAGWQAVVLLAKREIRRATLIACGAITVATLAFYAPMLRGILRSSHQKFGTRLPWYAFLTGPYGHLARPTVELSMPLPPGSHGNAAVTFCFVAVLTLAAVVRLLGRGDRAFLLHLAVPVFGTYVVLVAGRFYVQPRFASYLLFHVIVLLAIGGQQLFDLLAKYGVFRALIVIVIAVVAVTGSKRVVSLTEAEAHVPWENEQFVGNLVRATGLHHVVTNSTHPVALYYYAGRQNVTVLGDRAVKRAQYCKIADGFIFVDDRYLQELDPDVGCLLKRGAVQLKVPQQERPPIRAPGDLFAYVVQSAK